MLLETAAPSRVARGGPRQPLTENKFVQSLTADPFVSNWLISVSELDGTREYYLRWLVEFLRFTGWAPKEIFRIKREALKEGEPVSAVEEQIRRFHEELRKRGYAGKSRAVAVSALYSFLGSKGYTVPRKLVRLNASNKFEMRVPTRQEVETFLEYARSLEKKLVYTLMVETPCRPRVFPAMRWNWLEPEWWQKDVVHVILPKEFRPQNQSGPRKFEPVCFLGPKSLSLLSQLREARIRAGNPPRETDRILLLSYDALLITVRRDFEELVRLGLVRPSRTDEKGGLTEQSLTPKSWRKYQFNIIDALTDISPEWRKMLKGRDLQTERYYSQENIEALREIYRTRIYPQLWSDTVKIQESEEVKHLREQVEELRIAVRMLQDASDLKVVVTK